MKGLCFRFLFIIIVFFQKLVYKTIDYITKKKLKHCGRNVVIGKNCSISAPNVSIGNDVYIGDNAFISASISTIYIGNKVMFGPNVQVHSGNHRFDIIGRYMFDIKIDEKRKKDDLDVRIEDDVWVGAGVIILNGVTIHEGSIIGAGTVVTSDVPPYTIVTGSKEYKLRNRFTESELLMHKKLL